MLLVFVFMVYDLWLLFVVFVIIFMFGRGMECLLMIIFEIGELGVKIMWSLFFFFLRVVLIF